MEQWGYQSKNNITVTFPVSFAAAAYSINATIASSYGHARASAESVTKSSFLLVCRDDGGNIISSVPVYWFAIGK